MLWFEFAGTTIGALTETRVAKQQSRCKEFKRIQSCTRQFTMVSTVARVWQTLRSYLILCLPHLLPSFLASTTPSLPHQNKIVPFSHLPSLLHLWKGNARKRFLPQLPPMITSSLLTSPLMVHQSMSLYHLQHLTQSTRLSTFLMSLMMSLNTSLNLDSFPLFFLFQALFQWSYAKTNCVIYIVLFLEIGSIVAVVEPIFLFSILAFRMNEKRTMFWLVSSANIS